MTKRLSPFNRLIFFFCPIHREPKSRCQHLIKTAVKPFKSLTLFGGTQSEDGGVGACTEFATRESKDKVITLLSDSCMCLQAMLKGFFASSCYEIL
ncbi:hypothetical protein CEXT_506391 [Caerostris extrusa]|uniref:Uncharacterized protein n=1 Tax=Caerostris extrusa TaxID=172846 RepID=A0AAV4RUG3_CAEEX|nr:hypothetical protein CEXT_506391 [Caerostris extrusa]